MTLEGSPSGVLLFGRFNPVALKAHPELRSDLFGRSPNATLLTEFLASTGGPRFGALLPMKAAPKEKWKRSGKEVNLTLISLLNIYLTSLI